MSRIEELIRELCPNGVSFTSLSEVAYIVSGLTGKTKEDFSDGNSRFASYRNIFANPSLNLESPDFVKVNQGERQNAVREGDVLITGSSESLDEVGMSSVVASAPSEPIYVNSFCFIVRLNESGLLLPAFSRHLFRSESIRKQIRGTASGVTRINISRPRFMKIRIPVPPLDVQREIARVLDQFTMLEAALETELEARRAQYDYYASELLRADQDVPRVRIGSVATIVRGASPRPIQQFLTDEPDGAPWIKIGDVPANGKYITRTSQRVTADGAARSRRVTPGDFLLSNSMSFGRPYISKIEGYIHDGWLAIGGFNDSYIPDYLFYLLRSAPVQEEFKRRAGAGTVQNLNADIVRSVEIPLPPRGVQQRVVSLLDRFDALVSDTRIGIPAELSARRLQYAYYRDSLLTFEEAV